MTGDYYELLGVPKDADAKTIKAAYRKMAMQFHPDQNPGDAAAEAKFKDINEAYSVLSDPDKRARYDRFGKGGVDGMGAGAAGDGDPFDIFETVFGDLFGSGRGRRPQGPQRGMDVRADLEITLEEAFTGVTREIASSVSVVCTTCDGNGAAPGTKAEACQMCAGQGQVRAQQGFFTLTRTCPNCQGRGSVVRNPCRTCHGRGAVRQERKLSVDIPAGVDDGARIRVTGEGEASSQGGGRGDLYIFLSIKPHDIFERSGADLYMSAPVSMPVAALGGDIQIPTIDGTSVKVKVPEGTQTGRRLRLQGKGMTGLRSAQRGDMHVEVFVETPQKLNARQRQLLEEFQRECNAESHPQSQGFFDKVRKFFDSEARS